MRFYPDRDISFQLDQMLNRGLNLHENFAGVIVDVDLSEGRNEVRHGLGFVPIGYFVLVKQNEGDIFGTETDTWTKEILYVVSSAPSQKARLFVM